MAEPVIRVRGLRKRFGRIQALDGLEMHVDPGDVYGFLGPNGAGKSTTIRILTTLVAPDSGEISLFGEPVSRSRNAVLSKVGALIERPDFYLHLSAKNNLSLLARFSKMEYRPQDIFEVLELVGLKGRENDRVGTFSDGMKQRLGLAQALLHKPELVILDEPFNSLDPQGVKDVRDLILELNRDQGTTFIISSHQLDELEKLVNRLVVISEGRTVTEGSRRELLEKKSVKVHIQTDQAEKASKILKAKGFELVATDTLNGRVTFSCAPEEVPDINAMLTREGLRIYELRPDLSLESLFLDYTAAT